LKARTKPVSTPQTLRQSMTALSLLALSSAAAADDSTVATQLAPVTVIGTAPLPGSGVDIDKVPSNVQTVSSRNIDGDGRSEVVASAAARRLSSVNLNNEQGNQFQPDFVFRGFEASPISGIAQGLAVYQNGTRINESFGDSVNWDLVPQFAVDRLTVQGNNPVFGLNALGGAVTLDLKNGFTYQGTELELGGGSYGNLTGHAEHGARYGNFAVYGAVGGISDDGFRYRSNTSLRQIYGDVGYEDDRATLHLSVSLANNDIGAVGPTPVELLAQNPKTVFTSPQTTHNEAQLVQLAGSFQATDSLLLSSNVYFRHFLQRIVDGNTTNVAACGNNPDYFCLSGDGNYPNDALYDSLGNQVPVSVLPDGATPGEIDYASTHTASEGVSLQATETQAFFGHANHFVAGASFDRGSADYQARGELGSIQPDLQVYGAGIIIDQANSSTASPPLAQPVSVNAVNRYYGIYVTNSFDLTPRVTWSLSGRFNRAEIDLRDKLGTSLNGQHEYSRINPGTGLTWKITDALTGYGGYSETNRAPTANELSCADPESPCLLTAFLVSDPELHQVVSRTVEFGLRGHFATTLVPGHFKWNAGVFRTRSANDIILLSTQINGFGYYNNAGTTRRQGIETGAAWHNRDWDLALNYSLVDATFRENLTLASSSPDADADGNIFVQPGNHLPLSPRHRVTVDVDYSVTEQIKVGGDLRYVSGQYLVGDESNQEPKLPPYALLGVHGSWQFTHWASVFARIENLTDKTYATFGSFTQYDGLPANYSGLSNPRTYSPQPGRTFFAGMRVNF